MIDTIAIVLTCLGPIFGSATSAIQTRVVRTDNIIEARIKLWTAKIEDETCDGKIFVYNPFNYKMEEVKEETEREFLEKHKELILPPIKHYKWGE